MLLYIVLVCDTRQNSFSMFANHPPLYANSRSLCQLLQTKFVILAPMKTGKQGL